MDGERLVDSLWYKRLQARFRPLLLAAAREDMIVLCPQSISLVSTAISRADVEHHILRKSKVRGEFISLSGRKVIVSGAQVIASDGFPRQLMAKLLGTDSVMLDVPEAPTVAPVPEADGGDEQRSRPVSSSSAAATPPTESLSPIKAPRAHASPAPLSPLPLSPAPSASARSRLSSSFMGLMGSSLPTVRRPLSVYFISRPLHTGLAAPGGADDMDHGAVHKYASMLRASPETEVVFSALQAAIDRAATALRGRRGGEPVPPVHLALTRACVTAADALLTTSLYAHESAASRATIRRQLLQILECLVAEPLHDATLAALADELRPQAERLGAVFKELERASQADMGVKPAFVCKLDSVVATLGLLPHTVTPLEKLHCLRDTCMTLTRCVEAELEKRGVDLATVDFATDDILDMLLFVLVAGQHDHHTAELPIQLEYVNRMHFCAADDVEMSRLGYWFANFQQVLGFFEPEGRYEEVAASLRGARAAAAGCAAAAEKDPAGSRSPADTARAEAPQPVADSPAIFEVSAGVSAAAASAAGTGSASALPPSPSRSSQDLTSFLDAQAQQASAAECIP